MFSARTDWATHPNPISRLLEEKSRKKIKILDLTESNPTRCGFPSIQNDRFILKPFTDAKNLIYEPDPRGMLSAREAVCEYYAEKKVKLAPEQIFLTSSTSEAYGFLFRLLADSGDEVLAAEPSYPLFQTLADLSDVRLKNFFFIYSNAWRINQESLQKSFTAKTKALIIVHPNNPTGHFVSEEEKKFLRETCIEKNCAMIVDEVFLDYSWNLDRNPFSFAEASDVLTFTLSGISKILGLPQMKLSWIVVTGPELLRSQALSRLEVIADAHLSVNTPSQTALPQWMGRRKEVVGEINERVSGNFNFLKEKIHAGSGLQVLNTEGGWYAVLKSDQPMSDEAFAIKLLEEKNVLVHPGFFFDFPEENFWVLSLLPESLLFQEGIECLLECFKGCL